MATDTTGLTLEEIEEIVSNTTYAPRPATNSQIWDISAHRIGPDSLYIHVFTIVEDREANMTDKSVSASMTIEEGEYVTKQDVFNYIYNLITIVEGRVRLRNLLYGSQLVNPTPMGAR